MYRLSAREIHEKFMTGQTSARSIADYFLQRVQKEDPQIDAFLTVFSDDIRSKADLLDLKKAQGKPLGKMAAVPVAIKDNIHIHGKIMMGQFVADYQYQLLAMMEFAITDHTFLRFIRKLFLVIK